MTTWQWVLTILAAALLPGGAAIGVALVCDAVMKQATKPTEREYNE